MREFAIKNERGQYYNRYGALIEWFDDIKDAKLDCYKKMELELEFNGLENCKIVSVEIRREYEAVKS